MRGRVRLLVSLSLLGLATLSTGCGISALGGVLVALVVSNNKTSNGAIPTPVSVITPSTTTYDRVHVDYTLTDPQASAFDVLVEYSTNGAAGPFNQATEATGAPSQGLARLSASAAGNPHVFIWNSFADLQPQKIIQSKDVVVRVTAFTAGQGSTGAATGKPGLTQAFSVDNRLIATVAGSPSTEGEGVPAAEVPLVGPTAAVVVSGGAVFVADTGNARIRRGDPVSKLVTTYAGSGAAGSTGDNGPAVAAAFFTPRGVAVDSQNRVVIADTGNNRIRRVDATTGILSTIAGTGSAGFTGDNGLATSATLNAPMGIVVDAQGTIFFCDTGNNVVRAIDANGTIRTVAGTGAASASGDGGAATSAGLSAPSGLCVSTTGAIFVADTGNHAVRRFTVGGAIATVAGTLGAKGLGAEKVAPTASALNGPKGVALQGTTLVIADSGNNRLRRMKLDATFAPATTGGEIVTVAGALDGTAGFAGDNGPATAALLAGPVNLTADGSGGVIVGDAGNNRVRKLDSAGLITTVMGSGTPDATSVGDGGPATQAILTNVSQIALGPDGAIYFVELFAARVRKFTVGGTITTVAGNGRSGYSGDDGPATEASLNQPFGLAVDSHGVIFIADTSNAVIRAVNPVSGVITTFAGGGDGPDGVATLTSFVCPVFLASVPGQDQLLVGDVGNEVIRRVSYTYDPVSGDPAGAVTDVVCGSYSTFPGGFGGDGGPATSALLACPSGIDVDSNGVVYFVDQFGACVRKFTIGGNVSAVAGDPLNGAPGDENVPAASTTMQACRLSIDRKTNTIYIEELSTTTSRVRAFQDGGNITTVAGSSTAIADIVPGTPALAAPIPVLLGVFGGMPDGSVLAGSGGTRRILQFKPGGTIDSICGVAPGQNNGDGGPAIAATVRQCVIAVAPDETLYVGELAFGDIRRVDPKDGRISTSVGIGIRGLAGVGGALEDARIDRNEAFAVDSKGNLVITQANESVVVKADFAQQTLSLVAGDGTVGTAPFGDGGQATVAQVSGPLDVAFSPRTGVLYVSDTGHQTIRKIDLGGVITTVVGGGADTSEGAPALTADLTGLTTITVDKNDVIYFAQTSPTVSLVRKCTEGGTVTTVAGVLGTAGFNGDNIPGTQAQLNQPKGVAVDDTGDVFIADQFNHRVRRVDVAGFITTVAGTGEAGSGPDGVPAQLSKVNGPRHVVLDAAGYLWVGEEFGNRVRRFRVFP